MNLARPTTRLALLAAAALLVAAGVALWIERLRADGTLRLWPLLLVVVGTAKMGVGPSDQREEGLWLIGTGVWLMVETLVPLVMRGLGPLTMALTGLLALRWALPWARVTRSALTPRLATRENAHVN